MPNMSVHFSKCICKKCSIGVPPNSKLTQSTSQSVGHFVEKEKNSII